jgi:hypothetical protein
MLNSFKSKAVEPDQNTAANADELIGRTVQPPRTVPDQIAPTSELTATKSGPVSRIGSGMSIVGNVQCNGPSSGFRSN